MKRIKQIVSKFFLLLLFASLSTGCSYNPFLADNHLTGSPVSTAVGAGVGAGTVALLGGSKSYIIGGGLIGGAIGYYVSTLRYASGGVVQSGGKVYQVGDLVGIYIPTDSLFEPNSADFIPDAKPILDSTVQVLKRFPRNMILVSGNTSGLYRAHWEQKLSERRAQKVAGYLWSAGISNGNYVGYGDYFPVAKSLHNKGIRENSRIQIASYPSGCEINTGIKPKSIFDAF